MQDILAARAPPYIRHPARIPSPARDERRVGSRPMEALAVRLSQLDPQAEGAVRVIMFYDTLMRRRADLPALARATAGFAECVTGIRLTGAGRGTRMSPDGQDRPEAPASAGAPVVLDGEHIGTVWLERPGPSGPLDDLVLERLALAVTAVVERYGPAATTMADPALVELAISAETDEPARTRALRLLGFPAGHPIRVVAVRSALPLDQVARLICPGRPAKAAPLPEAGVILATTVGSFPGGIRAGVGAAGRTDLSWREARTALRFTGPRAPVVHHAELGALALLAEVPEATARANPDVAAIALLPESDLDTLDAYCATGSLRRAADLLHLHHSSVARRLESIAAALGIPLAGPAGLARARLALTAHRLVTG
ncbi:helix-turn-helix domain-containing protein [Nonomuraea typhae]|uniref:Helix-turn-helix domain-containing protein n=1 Tax=Nonomuraea typhae TaxID=2603600 RepID=A0ABW7Z2N7_9ACTN